jgi:hypothetical protein
MCKRIFLGLLLAIAVFSTHSAIAQTVAVSQEPVKPYNLDPSDSSLRARGGSTTPAKNPASFTNTFALVYRGPQGTMPGGAMPDPRALPQGTMPGSAMPDPRALPQGTMPGGAMPDPRALRDYSFPSLNFAFSAAAKIMPDDVEPGKLDGKISSGAELLKLNANVRIRGLDANKKPLASPRRTSATAEKEPEIKATQDSNVEEDPYLVVLGISPVESQFVSGESNLSKGLDAVSNLSNVNLFTRFMGGVLGNPISGLTAIFKNFIPRKDSPTQVAYFCSEEEFGWRWQHVENLSTGIEGIHQASAFMRTRKELRYLQVHVDLITDWRRFGAWVKGFDYIIAVPPPENPYP